MEATPSPKSLAVPLLRDIPVNQLQTQIQELFRAIESRKDLPVPIVKFMETVSPALSDPRFREGLELVLTSRDQFLQE